MLRSPSADLSAVAFLPAVALAKAGVKAEALAKCGLRPSVALCERGAANYFMEFDYLRLKKGKGPRRGFPRRALGAAKVEYCSGGRFDEDIRLLEGLEVSRTGLDDFVPAVAIHIGE